MEKLIDILESFDGRNAKDEKDLRRWRFRIKRQEQ